MKIILRMLQPVMPKLGHFVKKIKSTLILLRIFVTKIHNIVSNNNTRYHTFSTFYKRTVQIKIRKPQTFDFVSDAKFKSVSSMPKKFHKWKIDYYDNYILKQNFYQVNEFVAVHGGHL